MGQDKMNILAVEDNDIDFMMLKRGLKKAGITGALVRAHDGAEALEILHRQRSESVIPTPFLILLDINMPRMNGHEFMAALRETSEISDARVVFFTTSDNARDVVLAYGKFAAGYLTKPQNSVELSVMLEQLKSYWTSCTHPPQGMGPAPIGPFLASGGAT